MLCRTDLQCLIIVNRTLFQVRETSSASVVMCTRQSHCLHGCETDENYNVARGAATQKKVFENCLLDGEIMIIIDGQ